MGNHRRQLRVEGELQQIIASFLHKGFKYPLRGLVSITRIEASEKISTAKVFVTVMGSDEDRDISIETLQLHVHDIQKHVEKNLRIKYVPRISVHEDEGFYKMLELENKFRQIALEREAQENNPKPPTDEE